MIRRRKGLPDGWERTAAEQLGGWDAFDAGEREQLAALADWLLRHKNWEAAHGFTLDDVIRTTIAIEAAVLILALDTGYYREVSAIIVYPTTMQSRGVYAGPVRGTVTDGVLPVLGEAHARRPRHARRHPIHALRPCRPHRADDDLQHARGDRRPDSDGRDHVR